MIKSKINKQWWFAMFGMPPFIFVFVVFIGRGVIICMKEGISIGMICSLLFFVFLEYIILFLLREVKYIIIDKEKGLIKYYSILRIFGKTLKLKDFESKIKITEIPIGNEYFSIHSVNEKGYTAFKINGSFYENFEDLDISIDKPYIYNYRFSFWLYLKLGLTGRIKVENIL